MINNSNIQEGRKSSFLQLLKDCNMISIPKIQRDYAQGRIDAQNSNKYKTIRDGLLGSFEDVLVSDDSKCELMLDYIYGSKDDMKYFYPIDGQQRLTTLFLLHWYIFVKEDKLDKHRCDLCKFTYEIRDTTKFFCEFLLNITNGEMRKVLRDRTVELREFIISHNKYYSYFNEDPSVQAMINMLCAIHDRFCNVPMELYKNLDRIKFWILELKNFGLTDDLFIKMNARGKRLSPLDIFKTEMEASLNDDVEGFQKWKREIDNDYLDIFWSQKEFGAEFAERNLFRVHMFIINSLKVVDIGNDEENWLWEINDKEYIAKKEVEYLKNNVQYVKGICNILSNLSKYKSKCKDLFVTNNEEAKSLDYAKKVEIFGIIYWYSMIEDKIPNSYNEFCRILRNYICSQREPNKKTRQYSSQIDSKSLQAHLKFVKDLVDGFVECEDNVSFNEYIENANISGLEYEVEKLKSSDLDEIKKLEEHESTGRVLDNIYFKNTLHITISQLDEICEDPKLIIYLLKIILSYAKPEYGEYMSLAFDSISNQTGWKQLYYDSDSDKVTSRIHKYFFNYKNKYVSSCIGDRLLTSTGTTDTEHELSSCIKQFFTDFYDQTHTHHKTTKEAIIELYKSRLSAMSFANRDSIISYMVKYDDFYYPDSNGASWLVLKRYNDEEEKEINNVYDIRCADWNCHLEEKEHFQPFYKAVKRMLTECNSKLQVVDGVEFKGVNVEYFHPCTLSNGWVIRILAGGNWKIIHNNKERRVLENLSTSQYKDQLIDKGEYFQLNHNDDDCIEKLVELLKLC